MAAGTLVDLLEATTKRFPDRPAVVDSADAILTYRELRARARGLANLLVARGIRPGDRIAAGIPKSLDAVVSLFGIMYTGAAYVPVDAAGPIDRGRRILADCDIAGAIVNRRTAAMVPESRARSAVVLTVEDSGLAATEPSTCDDVPAGLAAHDLAYIIFTSGSTGTPKGVMITHANALSFLDWCSSEFTPDEHDRFANHAPLYFDPSVFDIYLAVKHGASVYLISDDLGKRPRDLAAYISRNRLTFWNSTPSALMLLVRHGQLEQHPASNLRVVAFGGEVFPPKALRELQQYWPAPAYYNMYGPTETTTACTFARIPNGIPADRTSPYPIGLPCSHCDAMLLDDDGNRAADQGLLYIAGPSVFAGYWKRPAETSAAFVERDGVLWYNTGDIVRWDAAEGFIYVGRKDRMVKRRGFRIELGEIERALHTHAAVEEAAAVFVRDADAAGRIVAFLACRGVTPSIVELKTFCAQMLPSYMSPDAFEIVETLPRTSTGKVDLETLNSRVLHAALR